MKLNELGELQQEHPEPVVEIRGNYIVVNALGHDPLKDYELCELTTQKEILRVAYQLLEKTWSTKRLVMDFIKLAAEHNNITYRN